MSYVYVIMWLAVSGFLFYFAKKYSKLLILPAIYFIIFAVWTLADNFVEQNLFAGVYANIFRLASAFLLLIWLIIYLYQRNSQRKLEKQEDSQEDSDENADTAENQNVEEVINPSMASKSDKSTDEDKPLEDE